MKKDVEADVKLQKVLAKRMRMKVGRTAHIVTVHGSTVIVMLKLQSATEFNP